MPMMMCISNDHLREQTQLSNSKFQPIKLLRNSTATACLEDRSISISNGINEQHDPMISFIKSIHW